MAGDWLKFEMSTPDKPEVWAIADELNIDPDAVVGKLLRVWTWFDVHTEKGNAPSVSKMLLDRLVGVTGFCNVVIKVGWMSEETGNLTLPNFDRHNGNTAKKRALTAKRVAKHKGSGGVNAKGNAPSVSDALPREEKRREEKRREESNKESKPKKAIAFKRPTLEEIQSYIFEKSYSVDPTKFFNHYESNGWKVGKNSMKNWKAAVVTWETRNKENETSSRTNQQSKPELLGSNDLDW